MKSITLPNLDDQLMAVVGEKARKSGKSLNRTMKDLLRKALGLPGGEESNNDFSQFLGVWDDQEFKAFEGDVDSMNQIDESEWK